jgi:RND superfamily putative drug exporter
MMRLSSSLRRYRWAVFVVWAMLLVPAVYLALTTSTGSPAAASIVPASQSQDLQYSSRSS